MQSIAYVADETSSVGQALSLGWGAVLMVAFLETVVANQGTVEGGLVGHVLKSGKSKSISISSCNSVAA